MIPGEQTRILVDSLLPAGLRGGAGATFSLDLAPAGVTVRPGQTLDIDTRLELTLGPADD